MSLLQIERDKMFEKCLSKIRITIKKLVPCTVQTLVFYLSINDQL